MTELYRYVVRDREGKVVHVFKSTSWNWAALLRGFADRGMLLEYCPIPTTNARAEADP